MIKEFKEFALKGNMMDLAVGIIIGGAFGKIISSLVNDIIMPLIGLLIGKMDFTNLFAVLGDGSYVTLADAQAAGALTLNYGLFINNIIDFIVIAFSIFLVVKKNEQHAKKRGSACSGNDEAVSLLFWGSSPGCHSLSPLYIPAELEFIKKTFIVRSFFLKGFLQIFFKADKINKPGFPVILLTSLKDEDRGNGKYDESTGKFRNVVQFRSDERRIRIAFFPLPAILR